MHHLLEHQINARDSILSAAKCIPHSKADMTDKYSSRSSHVRFRVIKSKPGKKKEIWTYLFPFSNQSRKTGQSLKSYKFLQSCFPKTTGALFCVLIWLSISEIASTELSSDSRVLKGPGAQLLRPQDCASHAAVTLLRPVCSSGKHPTSKLSFLVIIKQEEMLLRGARLATESFLWWRVELAGSPRLQLHHFICLNSQTTCGSGQSQEVQQPPLEITFSLWFIGNEEGEEELLRSHAFLGKHSFQDHEESGKKTPPSHHSTVIHLAPQYLFWLCSVPTQAWQIPVLEWAQLLDLHTPL